MTNKTFHDGHYFLLEYHRFYLCLTSHTFYVTIVYGFRFNLDKIGSVFLFDIKIPTYLPTYLHTHTYIHTHTHTYIHTYIHT